MWLFVWRPSMANFRLFSIDKRKKERKKNIKRLTTFFWFVSRNVKVWYFHWFERKRKKNETWPNVAKSMITYCLKSISIKCLGALHIWTVDHLRGFLSGTIFHGKRAQSFFFHFFIYSISLSFFLLQLECRFNELQLGVKMYLKLLIPNPKIELMKLKSRFFVEKLRKILSFFY